MDENELQFLHDQPECLLILQAYAERERQAAEPEIKGWGTRLSRPLAEPEQQSPDTDTTSHGLLIAMGYLDIELIDRVAGIHYRISPDGKRALSKLGNEQLPEIDEQDHPEIDSTIAADWEDQAA